MLSFISKGKSRSGLFISLFLAFVLVTGCRENQQAAANKQAKEAVDKALKEYSSTGDFDKAQKTLRQSLAGAPDAAKNVIVLMTQGSFEYGKAVNLRTGLDPIESSIQGNLDELSETASKIAKLQSERIEIESVLRSRIQDKQNLQKQLEGDANGPGLISKQKDAESKLAQINTKHDQLQQSISEKLKQASDVQHQADELLAKADSVGQPEKSELQQKAYNILKDRNAYQLEAQELQDQINIVASQIAVTKPLVDSLGSEIEKVRKRLDDLNKSDFESVSNQRLANIGTESAKVQDEFSSKLSQLEQIQSQLTNKVKDITELLKTSENDFKKSASQEILKDFGRVAGAEALAFEGSIRGNYALFQRQLAARLTILGSGEMTESQAQLKTLAQKYLDDSDDSISKAIADYNDASNLYSKIPVKKDDFSTAVLKNRILVLAQKAYLADRVELTDIKTQTVEQAKELIDKAVKNDPSFESALNEPPYNVLISKTAEEPAPKPGEKIAESNEPKAKEPNRPAK